MSAQIRIMPQIDADGGFSLLKDIVAMVKNPDAIDEAYQRRLDAAKLTDDEVAKAEAARALIAQADALNADLEQQRGQIQSDRETLNKDISDFETKKQSDTLRLGEWETQLNNAGYAHTQAEVRNQVRAKELDDLQAQIAADNAAKQQDIDAQALALAGITQAQKDEADRLATWRDQLKDKAGKLAALAQSDG